MIITTIITHNIMTCIGCDAINMLTTCAAHGGPQWLTGLYMRH